MVNKRIRAATAIPLAAVMLVGLQPGLAPAQTAPAQSDRQLSAQSLDQYATAFVHISELRRDARLQEQILPADQRPVAERRLAQGIAQALTRAGLKEADFNRMTKLIESNPGLRRRVRQRVMEKVVGI